ncbi:histidine phosphatase family protein [Paraburkholderia ferrariae]|jgi:broad specificity phosphatase PhoE|uniref:histidine phosphatase family protein n=1 Tax=Paraburkholderia ferrariae TaxID=386056 RepID=UPI00047F729A|nr:histidine phosphatase family protein [Paraburkholderia ferrariae]
MRIILTRHGLVEGIDPPRFRGRAQLALTALGQRQAQALASAVSARYAPTIIYTSPRQRCRDTGNAIASTCSVESRVEHGLDDLDYGEWQWKTYDVARAQFPAQFALWKSAPQWMRFPGGESLQVLASRTADVIRGLVESHARETVVLVAHDSVNRVILTQALELPLSAYWRLEQAPCCINVLDLREDGRVCVHQINETAHLEGVS